MTGERTAGSVASPCTSVCTMDAVSGLCVGCYRTLDEIAGWIAMSDDQKRRVLADLGRRARITADAGDGRR